MGTERDFVVKKGLKVAEGITLGGHTFDDIDIGSEFVDTDDHLMSSGAIKEKIESYSYGTGDATLAGTQTFSGAKTFSAVAKISNGSVSAPALSFSTQTNQGMYRISSGSTGFTSSGQLKLTVDPYGITVGDGNSAGYVNAKGTQDLILRTNDGTNSGSITITDGANSDISITPNGTGQVNLGNFQFDVDQTVGSDQDNYVLTYDHANTQISLEAAAGGGGALGNLTDVLMDATNFTDGLLIQPDSDGSAPTTGTLNSAEENIGIGKDVLSALTSADYTTFVGSRAGEAITSGSYNTGFGRMTLYQVTTQTNNTAVGYFSGGGIQNGGNNTAIGTAVLGANNSASQNTGVGSNALGNTTGNNNTALGYRALYANTSGTRNIAIGVQALDGATTETDNIAIGHEAMYNPNGGDKNVAIGNYSLDALTTANNNVAIGHSAGSSLITQGNNVMIGWEAGTSSTSVESTYIGYYAGRNNLSNYNVAIGAEAMITYGDKTAERNTAIGNAALKVIETGDKNTSVGGYSGIAVTTGSDNVFLGYQAGNNITTGSNNVVIGAADVTATGDDQLSISSGDGDVTWITGNSSGGINSKAEVVAATSGTTLTLAQSGSYVFWTNGSLTLPASGTVGTQYTIFNNTGGSATVQLNASNCSIVSGWPNITATGDHEATTFVCVTANNWLQIG